MEKAKLQSVRGTQDLLPETSRIFREIEVRARNKASLFGYGEIQTPLFEFSDVFHRTLGDTSDIVGKETYTFLDRGGDSLTLRPEGTAGISRAFISEGLAQNIPLKLFYCGPMFRYERPQKGRLRQFHQIGVECLGPDVPFADVECISLGQLILEDLGLKSNVKLFINTIGDLASRAKYREQLVSYYTPFRSELSHDSQIRLDKNPLRILDSKDEKDKKINQTAPKFESCFNDESKKFFDDVLAGLQTLNITYEVDSRLVRGLDYYTHTVFEFVTTDLGAQGTVLAGGRYDGLIASMGGPQTAAVGWAAGIERLMALCENHLQPSPTALCVIAPADDAGEKYSLIVAAKCRALNLRTEILWSGNVGKKLKKANALNADLAIILGSTEVQSGQLAVKNLKTGTQVSLRFDELTQITKLINAT